MSLHIQLTQVPRPPELAIFVPTTTTTEPIVLVYLSTGLDHWTGLLDWTTGLTYDPKWRK